MKKTYLALIAVVFVSVGLMLIASGWAQMPSTALKDKDYTQPEAYTATNFGPWNEAVATTHVP